MKNKNGKYYAKVMVLVVSLVVLAFSATYAYFTMSFTGEAVKTTVTAGSFNITSSLERANAIVNRQMLLIDEADKDERAESLTFTVTSSNDTDVDGEFYLYVQDIKLTKNLSSEYFKWEILKGDEIVSNGTFKDAKDFRTNEEETGESERVVLNIDQFKLNENGVNIPKATTTTYTFRLYLVNDANRNQIELTEGSFEGKLFMEAVPVA